MGLSVSGVGVVDKAVAVLSALRGGPLGLSELTAASALPRATVYRLATALEHHGMLARDGAGRFLLGPLLTVLARDGLGEGPLLTEIALPALRELRDRTEESTQLFVRRGEVRVCTLSLESPHSLRTIVAVGAVLPLDRGSAAKVLTRQTDALRRGWAQSVEEREAGVASVSAPVVFDGQPVAAISVSGPIERTTRRPGRLYAAAVCEAAEAVSRSLVGHHASLGESTDRFARGSLLPDR